MCDRRVFDDAPGRYIEPKIGPSWPAELANATRPGGRWNTILQLLRDGPLNTGRLYKETRNQELNSQQDKYRFWESLKELQKQKMIIRKGGPVIITPKGRQTLINWNEGLQSADF